MSKVTNPAVTAKCGICDQVIGGKNERGLRQGMGVHLRVAHGIKKKRGQSTAMLDRAKAANQARWAGHVKQTPEEVRARAKANYLAKKNQTAANNGAPALQQASDAVPCKLSECPCCNTRFYMVRGQ